MTYTHVVLSKTVNGVKKTVTLDIENETDACDVALAAYSHGITVEVYEGKDLSSKRRAIAEIENIFGVDVTDKLKLGI